MKVSSSFMFFGLPRLDFIKSRNDEVGFLDLQVWASCYATNATIDAIAESRNDKVNDKSLRIAGRISQ